ncbi:MAG TPA: hypothetical protein V6C89_07870 [Drouetiella sp.]
MFYKVNPQYCGEFGRKTLYSGELTDVPPKIFRMHGEFNIYPDDDLVEISRQYLGTESLAQLIRSIQPHPTGLHPEEVITTTTFDFRRNYPGKELPAMKWFKVIGKAGVDDFGMSKDYQLVISARVLGEIKSKMNNCLAEKFEA